MLTVLEIIKRTTEFLATKGIESPRLNAELLLGHVLGRRRMELYLEFERPLTETELALLRPLVRRRALREPLQYVLGEMDFAGITLKVDCRALIPRPETERLVEVVLAWARAHPPVIRILDLGTGSGAIALALGHAIPTATVVAIERSPEALALAAENIAFTKLSERVSLVPSDWYDAAPIGPFDVVVSNPPYLSVAETAEAQPEVRKYEPPAALTSLQDGVGDLERIVAGAPTYLRPGGLLALETGVGHHARLLAAARSAGFSEAESKPDLAGRDRFILAVL